MSRSGFAARFKELAGESPKQYVTRWRMMVAATLLHEGDPSLADEPLSPGAVFTVEPWYYNHEDEIAVFVEDVILVTEDGAESLTASLPRSADELERMVGLRD